MRYEVIKCDECKKEHNAEYQLPAEWITTTQMSIHGVEEERHFCCRSCLIAWASREVRNV